MNKKLSEMGLPLSVLKAYIKEAYEKKKKVSARMLLENSN